MQEEHNQSALPIKVDCRVRNPPTLNGIPDLINREDELDESSIQKPASDLEKGTHESPPAELSKIKSEPAWSVFGRWEKKWIVLTASLGAFFSPMTTNIYFPALNDISSDLHVSINKVNLSITTYMVSISTSVPIYRLYC